MNLRRLSCTAVLGLAMGMLGSPSVLASSMVPTVRPSSREPIVSPSQATPIQVAQSVVGQCRQLRRIERVYSGADLATTRVADLSEGTRVTLAGAPNQPSFGWIQISYPYSGYVQTAFLLSCGGTPPVVTPPPQATSCGIVTEPFLSLRSGPSTLSAFIQELTVGQGFKIVGGRQTQLQPLAENGRVWLQVERLGTTGWLPETGPRGIGANFRQVTCSSIGIQ